MKTKFAESYSEYCCGLDVGPPELVDSSDEVDSKDQERPRTRTRWTKRSQSGEPFGKTTARENLQPQPIELTALKVLQFIDANKLTSIDEDPYDSEIEIGASNFEEFEGYTESREAASHPPDDARRIRRNSDGVVNGLSIFTEKPGRTISIVNKPDEWVAITVTVDSGACVTVMPSGLCMGIPIVDNDLSRAGVEYEVANGESIPNLGERQCQVMTAGSMIPKKITFQIAEVHKPLLSVAACSDMGFDCFLGQEGGTLKDRVTGECIPLERHGSLYSMKMWVRQNPEIPTQGFSGPG